MLKVLIPFAIVSFSSPLVKAESEPLNPLKTQFESVRKKLTEGDEKQRQIMSSLFEINRKMKKLVSERGKSEQERMSLQSSTKELADKILALEKKIKEERELLQYRLNAMYKIGGQGLARITFSSTNSAQLERNLKIMGIIAKRDLALMTDYSKSVNELSQKQKKFLIRLAALKKAQSQVAAQEYRISSESEEKIRILDNIRKSKNTTITKLRQLREKGQRSAQQEDDDFLDLLLTPSFFERKGNLPMPVHGHVVRKFGLWKDAAYNVTLNQKGLLFEAPAGSSVQAVFPGKIAFEGLIEGFGKTLIIDHGDHYYSVYSGLSQVVAENGSEIAEGQKIAAVESGLYFEIRHFSEPYDPESWMKGQ